ncbi:MAG: dicarboxylate/amino acid:cation symporter [Gammaproteobacteria bacterium]|nr:dicarboxylate/amino acid:cation symporter [Gammaproteobacteria bacterium]
MKTKDLLYAIGLATLLVVILSYQDKQLVSIVQNFAQLGGQLFLNALMMGVAPLIVVSIITGALKLSLRDDVADLAPRVIVIFMLNTFFAAALAFSVFTVAAPILLPAQNSIHDASVHHIAHSTVSSGSQLLKLFPRNIFKALVELDMVGLVVFGLFFGSCLGYVLKKSQRSEAPLLSGLSLLLEAIMQMVRIVMKAMPIGVFALILDAGLKMNWHTIYSLSAFIMMFATVVLSYVTILTIVAKRFLPFAVGEFFQKIYPALVSAFSTSSSVVALPVALDVLENDCHVSSDLTRFLMPLGITVNMAGTTMFVTLGALYLSYVAGLPATLELQLYVFILSWFTSLGIAGVPSGCLVALMLVLAALGIPEASLALLIGFDRFLDMVRTAINMFGNLSCTMVISRLSSSYNENV